MNHINSCAYQVTAGLLIFKEVKHGLHFTERSGVRGEKVA